jgi:hypothetical protein
MIIADTLHTTAHLTFGRETAQFKQLIALLALVSIVLWSVVLLSMIARLVLCRIWGRQAYSSTRTNLPPF